MFDDVHNMQCAERKDQKCPARFLCMAQMAVCVWERVNNIIGVSSRRVVLAHQELEQQKMRLAYKMQAHLLHKCSNAFVCAVQCKLALFKYCYTGKVNKMTADQSKAVCDFRAEFDPPACS
eukprot:1301283-Amphidinium_carterae.1